MRVFALLSRLLGYEGADTLETHLFFTLSSLVTLGGFLALTINLALDHFLGDIVVSASAILVGGSFSLIGRRMKSPERLGPAIILLVGVAVSLTWFTNGGVAGSSMGWFGPLVVISTVMLKDTTRILTLAALMAMIFSCATMEFLSPQSVTGHSNPDFAFLDTLSVFVATSVILALLSLLLTQAYRQQRDRVAELVENSLRDELEIKLRGAELEALRDLLPICAHCHQIRDEQGDWHGLETYMQVHRSTDFSHSICPGCAETHFG